MFPTELRLYYSVERESVFRFPRVFFQNRARQRATVCENGMRLQERRTPMPPHDEVASHKKESLD